MRDVVHAVLQELFVDALHVFVDGAHFGGADELGRKSEPRVLIALA
jgi:hypothetical protein